MGFLSLLFDPFSSGEVDACGVTFTSIRGSSDCLALEKCHTSSYIRVGVPISCDGLGSSFFSKGRSFFLFHCSRGSPRNLNFEVSRQN